MKPSEAIKKLVDDLGDNKMLAETGWSRNSINSFIVNWMLDNNITIRHSDINKEYNNANR